MDKPKALLALSLAALSAGVAPAADAPPACNPGPIAIQIDQLFEKTGSYAVARNEMMPRGRPEYGPFRGAHGGMSTSRVTQRLHGEARSIAPLSFAGRAVSGAAAMTVPAEEHIRHKTQSCNLKRAFAVAWKFEGALSDQCTLDLTVTRERSGGAADRGCAVDVFGTFAGHYPTTVESWQISLKPEEGATAKRELGNFAAKDVSTLTVVRVTAAP